VHGVHLVIEVNAGTAVRDLHDQLGRAYEIFLGANPGTSDATGFQTEAGVGLRCIVGVEDDGGIGEETNTEQVGHCWTPALLF
jgi:hypothetical protein